MTALPQTKGFLVLVNIGYCDKLVLVTLLPIPEDVTVTADYCTPKTRLMNPSVP